MRLHNLRRTVEEGTLAIEDYTPCDRKIATRLRTGREAQARATLPSERVTPLSAEWKRKIGAS